jgi:hypothetical protein
MNECGTILQKPLLILGIVICSVACVAFIAGAVTEARAEGHGPATADER